MTDLYEQIRTAVTERLKLAEAATLGPWRYNPAKAWHLPDGDPSSLPNGEEFVGAGPLDATIGVAATGPADEPQAMADAAHIAANDPAFTIRAARADLARLERHQCEPGLRTAWFCRSCRVTRPGYCVELLDLAAVYGIEVT